METQTHDNQVLIPDAIILGDRNAGRSRPDARRTGFGGAQLLGQPDRRTRWGAPALLVVFAAATLVVVAIVAVSALAVAAVLFAAALASRLVHAIFAVRMR